MDNFQGLAKSIIREGTVAPMTISIGRAVGRRGNGQEDGGIRGRSKLPRTVTENFRDSRYRRTGEEALWGDRLGGRREVAFRCFFLRGIRSRHDGVVAHSFLAALSGVSGVVASGHLQHRCPNPTSVRLACPPLRLCCSLPRGYPGWLGLARGSPAGLALAALVGGLQSWPQGGVAQRCWGIAPNHGVPGI